jgi:hypothetical protein
VPITLEPTGSFSLDAIRAGRTSFAAHGALSGPTRIGNRELDVRQQGLLDRLVLQLDRGGALRWATTLAPREFTNAIDLTPRDEVVIIGARSAIGGDDTPAFVRIYAR